MAASKLSITDANAFLIANFKGADGQIAITQMEDGCAIMRMSVTDDHLRPGGYISGPTQMAIADSTAYMAVMSRIGLVPMAVTSNLNINFLRPCIGDALIGEAKIMKLGKTLAVMDVDIRAENAPEASSHAIVTYALPREI
ncbi:MAG: PaaI family thioesterase [Henriciella sp.]